MTNYWVAGKLKGVDGWDEKDSEENNLVKDEVRFVRSSESGVYTVTLDMWKDDQFKIRYLGRGWDDEGGQLNATNNFDEEANGDTTNGLAGESGSGMGGKNFQCYNEGNYTVTINANGEKPMVTWTRNGDATVKAPIAATGVTVKNGETEVTSLTMRVGDADITLSATVAPDNATDKTVKWESSDATVFTVSETEGKVHAVAVGTANLKAKVGDKTLATIPVTIVAAGETIVEAESITIAAEEKTKTAHVGDTVTVTPTIAPANTTNRSITYTSDTTTVVNIVEGAIKAVAPGTATITAKTANNKTDTFTVTVVNDYYLAGTVDSVLSKSWNKEDKFSDIPTAAVFTRDANDATKYTLEVGVEANQEFVILNMTSDSSWSGKIGNTDGTAIFENSATTDTAVTIGTENIKVKESGKYLLTLTVPATGDPTLTYKYTGEYVPAAWNYDIVAHGAVNGEGSWADLSAKAEDFKADALSKEYTVTLAENFVFGFKIYKHGTSFDKGWWANASSITGDAASSFEAASTNIKCNTAGDYTFTVTFDANGSISTVSVVAAAA